MIIKLFKQYGIKVVNIVRKDEHVKLLKEKYGAEYVFNSTDDDFDAKLAEISDQLGCKVGLDAIAGEMPGRIL